MPAFVTLTMSQLRLAARDVSSILAYVGVPIGLMLVFGLLWDDTQAITEDPRTRMSFLPAMTIGLGILLIAVFHLPAVMADYREKKILRWLSTTPVPTGLLLVAQIVIALILGITIITVLLILGALVGVPTPADWSVLVLVLILGVGQFYGIGLLIAALAPTVATIMGVGFLVMFPSLFLGGLWVPVNQLPDVLQRIAGYAPLSLMVDSIAAAWNGDPLDASRLAVMAAIAILTTAVALRWFRWE